MKIVFKIIFNLALLLPLLSPKFAYSRHWHVGSGQWDALSRAIEAANLNPNADTILLAPNSIFDFADLKSQSNKNAFFTIAKGTRLCIFGQNSSFENKKQNIISNSIFVCEQQAVLIISQLQIRQANFESLNTAFLIDQQSRLELYRCKFQNNTSDKLGLVFARDAYVICFQSEFKNNISNGNGTAIQASNSGINLKKCHFINNSAKGKESTGGAVYWENGISNINQLYIDGCVFTQNCAETKAGALAVAFKPSQPAFANQIIIKKSIFTDNKSGIGIDSLSKGGACWIGNSEPKTNLTQFQPLHILFAACTFYSNQSYLGGALYVATGQVRISNCELNENQAGSAQDLPNGQGGGMYVAGGQIDIDASRISNNFAALQGGGIYCKSTAKMRIFDTQIAYNKIGQNITATDAQKSEGAIFRIEKPSVSDTLHIGNPTLKLAAKNNILYSFNSEQVFSKE